MNMNKCKDESLHDFSEIILTSQNSYPPNNCEHLQILLYVENSINKYISSVMITEY